MNISWDGELASLLTELSATQRELLVLLDEKRALLVAGDTQGLTGLHEREHNLIGRLQACHAQRRELLDRAASEGLPSDSIRSLSAALPGDRRVTDAEVQHAASRARLLQHHSLAQWVVVQRTLLHLSQLLEIIATGGRPQPTYGKEAVAHSGGTLLDQAA